MVWMHIDYTVADNCLAWYDLRHQLMTITNINLSAANPMLRIAIIQFVLVWVESAGMPYRVMLQSHDLGI